SRAQPMKTSVVANARRCNRDMGGTPNGSLLMTERASQPRLHLVVVRDARSVRCDFVRFLWIGIADGHHPLTSLVGDASARLQLLLVLQDRLPCQILILANALQNCPVAHRRADRRSPSDLHDPAGGSLRGELRSTVDCHATHGNGPSRC